MGRRGLLYPARSRDYITPAQVKRDISFDPAAPKPARGASGGPAEPERRRLKDTFLRARVTVYAEQG